MLTLSSAFSLSNRKRLACLLLSVAIIGAGYIAIPRPQAPLQHLPPDQFQGIHWLAGIIELLNRLEVAHITAHVVVFGGVALLLGPWGREPGSTGLVMRYALRGAVIMELVQVAAGYTDDTFTDLLVGCGFDLVVDAAAVALVLALGSLRFFFKIVVFQRAFGFFLLRH